MRKIYLVEKGERYDDGNGDVCILYIQYGIIY